MVKKVPELTTEFQAKARFGSSLVFAGAVLAIIAVGLVFDAAPHENLGKWLSKIPGIGSLFR